MPVFPGDPGVVFDQVASIQNGGYNVTRVTIGTHTGTHVDVPHHCIHSEQTVDRLSLDALVGWAEVLDLGELAPGYEIAAADLDVFENRIGMGARVLLRTGWSKRFGRPEFFTDFPGLTEGAALWLTARNVKLVGIEQPSVHSKRHLAVHKALLSAGIVLIETMANLGEIAQDRVYMAALPLNLVGLDGSPLRAVAIEWEDGEQTALKD
jgi:kynurenine formamidase